MEGVVVGGAPGRPSPVVAHAAAPAPALAAGLTVQMMTLTPMRGDGSAFDVAGAAMLGAPEGAAAGASQQHLHKKAAYTPAAPLRFTGDGVHVSVGRQARGGVDGSEDDEEDDREDVELDQPGGATDSDDVDGHGEGDDDDDDDVDGQRDDEWMWPQQQHQKQQPARDAPQAGGAMAGPDGMPMPQRRLKRRAPSSTHSSSTLSSRTSAQQHHLAAAAAAAMAAAAAASGAQHVPSRHPLVSLADFDILRVLGKGSHGTVYLVRHHETNRLLAMKSLRKSSVLKKKQLENTIIELKFNAKLAREKSRCPYMATLRFAFHSQTRLFMLFDYCGGGELYFHLGRRVRLPETLARFYAAEIAISIGYLHASGVAYRDLKPENLVLDATGHVNLVDFGLCRLGVTSPIAGITSTSGTTEYLAPEVLAGHEHGLSVDWWAFGMVLYEFLFGLPPWFEDGVQDRIVARVLARTPVTFPAGVEVSPRAKDLLSRLLVHDPRLRLGSGGGAREVMLHPFFEGVDWVKFARRGVEPPFVPPSTMGSANEDDALPGLCNFDPEFTLRFVTAPAKDYAPALPGDVFEGFYFDWRDLEGAASSSSVAAMAAPAATGGVS